MNPEPEPASESPMVRTGPGDIVWPPGEASASESASPSARTGRVERVGDFSAQVASRTRPPRGWRQTASSLKNRDFLFLWLGLLAMMGGLQMQMLVRGFLVYDITGSAALLGLVTAGAAVPILALSLIGGAVADRVERKRVIQISQAANALIALFVGVSIITDAIAWYHLLIASVFQGALWSFLMPARQAIIPQLVGRDQLTNAIALNSAGMSAATLVAPALAGGLYAALGPGKVYFIISGLGFASLILTGMIARSGTGPARPDAAMMSDIVAGLSYIWRNPFVLVLLLMGLSATLFAMPVRSLMPVFVVDIYHRGPDSMGLLLALIGGGSLAGSLGIAVMGRWRRGLLLIAGSLISGIALVMLALFPFYFAAAGIMLLLGLGDAGRRTLNQSLIMEEVEDRFRGRVSSVFMMSFGLTPLGVLPAGIIADWLGGQAAMAVMAVPLLVLASVAFATQKSLREAQ